MPKIKGPRKVARYTDEFKTPKQDNFNKIPELQVCITEALYDADDV